MNQDDAYNYILSLTVLELWQVWDDLNFSTEHGLNNERVAMAIHFMNERGDERMFDWLNEIVTDRPVTEVSHGR